MTLSLSKFVSLLENSGVIPTDALQDHLPPKRHPKDAHELAYALIRRKKLTKYQAEAIARGEAQSLILGNYLLLKRVGAGAYGQVFKARHRRLDRTVAVKVLHAQAMKTERKVARFAREAKATAKINHPNIVAVYDADSAHGVHFLVMEYVRGADLATLIAKNKRFSIKQTISFVTQAAKGLEAAHAAGVIHRDIKPANLLLDRKGTIKVLDLGLALSHDDVDEQAELTADGMTVGTVNYMAPEQALSSKTADARADVYSLGCTLYSILTGNLMYDGDTLVERVLAHREMPIPSLRSVRPDVPEPLEAVYRKMVAKHPDDRYQTMTDVIAALKRCANSDEHSIDTKLLLEESQDVDLLHFLTEITDSPAPAAAPKSIAPAKSGSDSKDNRVVASAKPDHVSRWREFVRDRRVRLWGGGAICAALLVAGMWWKLAPVKGTLVVEVNEPGATVQLLDDQNRVTLSREAVQDSIRVPVKPGMYRLKVAKEGFKPIFKVVVIGPKDEKNVVAKFAKPEPKKKPDGSQTASSKAADTLDSPEFRQWMDSVVEMSPDAQVSAVVKKLQELNPGFDGQATHRIENAVVVELAFVADQTLNIAPVRALLQLKNLRCHGTVKRWGRLADLSPLKGMHLTTLDVRQSAVVDLRPLVGMPLANLTCEATQVSDLTPLRGMPLTHLNTGNTLVTDLAPLKQLRLLHLSCCVTQVSSLEPLKGMPLKSLDCRNTAVTDFSPLRESPLTTLWCDIQPQRDAPVLRALTTLAKINDKPVAEFWQEPAGASPAKAP